MEDESKHESVRPYVERIAVGIRSAFRRSPARHSPDAVVPSDIESYGGLHRDAHAGDAAAHLGHHQMVSRPIEGGAPLDHVNNLNWTALIKAVVLGDGGPDRVATVRALADAGADQTITDREDVSPLDHAKARGYDEMVEILETAN